MDVNPTIFREYDIRGLNGSDLSDDMYYHFGRAVGTYLGAGPIVVGRDNRPTSKDYSDSLIRGLVESGMKVVDIGEVPSPVVYFAIHFLSIPSGAVVTASHNPSEYNGLKVLKGKHCIYGKEIQKLLRIIREEDYADGEGAVEERNVDDDYISCITTRVRPARRLKVVLDCGNGVTSRFGPRLLRGLGCEVVELFCESDGTFPNHHPDPTKPGEYSALIKTVREEKADLGIAYDGDGDRLGAITEKGEMIFGDQMMILFAREVLAKHPGAKICIEVKCSQGLFEDVEAHGGKAIWSMTGHSLIEALMQREHALLTGEMSGHLFFADEYYGFDDAMYASARLIRILAAGKKTLSGLLADAPKYYPTPEIRVDCPDEVKFGIVKEATARFKRDHDVIDIDGVRVLFPDGWGLIRASNTQPALVLRAEGKTVAARDRIKGELKKALSAHKEIRLDF
ncbi:phosphomannomutase/phosphoglucomutase [Candidatus Woesearchaeota archaeon]|nr:phosphomannomutase/phosphoglucomutase [Candidatus Woesearchaeota archaeon]